MLASIGNARLVDRRRISAVGFCGGVLLAGACSAPAPQPSGTGGGASDNQAIGSPCSEEGKALIAKSSSKTAVDNLCSYLRGLIDEPKYFYSGPAGAKTFTPLFPSDTPEKPQEVTEGQTTFAKMTFYTGLKVDSKDPQAVADVLRLQTHFPSEYKSNAFEAEPDVTFTPSNPDLVNFAGTAYSYLKPQNANDKRIEYDGRVQVFSFGGGGVAVVDKLEKNKNSMLVAYQGVLLIIPDKDYVAVIGRTEQTLNAEKQPLDDVKNKLAAKVIAAVERDYRNYKRASNAKTVMDGKRAKSGGK